MRFISLLLTLFLGVMMAVPAMSMAAQPPPTVPLGTTSSFAVLAGSTITNTGTTNIGGNAGGDIGLSPGSAFTDQGHVTTSGAIHLADVVAGKAKKDLTAAYLSLIHISEPTRRTP